MRIVSFAYTTPALLAGAKTVTRRDWNPAYAAGFRRNDLVAAWDRSPRFGGRPVAIIRLTADPVREPIGYMMDLDYDAEGFRWLHDHLDQISVSGRRRFGSFGWDEFETWRRSLVDLWVVRFKLVTILPVPVAGAAA